MSKANLSFSDWAEDFRQIRSTDKKARIWLEENGIPVSLYNKVQRQFMSHLGIGPADELELREKKSNELEVPCSEVSDEPCPQGIQSICMQMSRRHTPDGSVSSNKADDSEPFAQGTTELPDRSLQSIWISESELQIDALIHGETADSDIILQVGKWTIGIRKGANPLAVAQVLGMVIHSA